MRLTHVIAVLAAAVLWSASPQAGAQAPGVMEAAVDIADEAAAICSDVVSGGRDFEAALEGKPWTSIDARSTGSNLATHAWRAPTANQTFLMRLPNGGCSFAVDEGDGEAMRARVLERLGQSATFELISQQPARGGRATMSIYCVREDYPRAMSMIVGERGSRPRLMFNMFRASTPAPDFCRSA